VRAPDKPLDFAMVIRGAPPCPPQIKKPVSREEMGSLAKRTAGFGSVGSSIKFAAYDGRRGKRKVVPLLARPGTVSDFSLQDGPAITEITSSLKRRPHNRPTDRELNFGADRAYHCRQKISATPSAPAVQHFRMQPACHRLGPQVDRRACSSG
jgi:hypothetical protein